MKEICLGSAMWGWSVEEPEVFRILDFFYQSGYRYVDIAWNYPINGVEGDQSLACKILSSWVEKTGVTDLKIIFKIGAKDNLGSVEGDLTSKNLLIQIAQAKKWFGANLHCAMVHWDNRDQEKDIAQTVEVLTALRKEGVYPGLSGIGHPEHYLKLMNSGFSDIYIQAKHNVLHSDIHRYSEFLKKGSKLFTYGISGSGLKISQDDYRTDSYVALVRDANFHERMLPEKKRQALTEIINKNLILESMYHVGISFSEINSDVFGYIISPSRYDQVVDSLTFIRNCDFAKLDLEGI